MINLKNTHEMGFSMIEVLITIVILAVGLLGLAGLQARALTSQMESYQRSQALILVKDMENRINANRANAASYVANPVPAAATTCSGTMAQIDLCEWKKALNGSAEGLSTGAMIGATACIYELSSTAPKKYLIAVAWQGLTRTVAPAVNCGQGNFGSNDAFRRVITVPVTIGNLT
jgi:type IV pilus assembly protein PilV